MSDGQIVPQVIYTATEARFAQEHRQVYDGEDHASRPPVPLPSAFMFRAVDVNTDGVTDWLVDFYRGSHGLAGFCGTGGCLQELYVSQADGTHVLALSAQTLGLEIRKREAALPLVTLSVHGIYCAGLGGTDCRIGLQWSDRSAALIPVASAMTTASVRSFSPLKQSPLAPPQSVLRKLEADGEDCAAVGMVLPADVARESAYPLLDFNGDGVLDWLVAPYCDEPEQAEGDEAGTPADAPVQEEPQLASTLFISRQQDFVEAIRFNGESSVFLSEPRPVFVVKDEENDCYAGMGSHCATKSYFWNEAAGTMQPIAIEPLSADNQQALQQLEDVVLADRWPLTAPDALMQQAQGLEKALTESRPPNDLDLARVRFALGALLLDRAAKPAAESKLRLAADAMLGLGSDQVARLARAKAFLARAIDAPKRIEERAAMASFAFYSLEAGPQTAWLRNRAAELLIPALYRTSSFTVSAEDLALLATTGAGQGADSWGDPVDFQRYAAGLARREFRWDDAIALDQVIVAGAKAEHADYAHLAADLATIARLDEAESIARKAVSLAEREMGRDHVQTLRAKSDLGEDLLRAGKVDEAEGILQGVVARMSGVSASSHDLPLALRRLADCTLVLGRVADAEPLLERALAAEAELLDRFILSEDYDDFAATRALARVQVLTGKGRKAARALSEALQLASNENPSTLALLLDYVDLADVHATADERSMASYFAKADDASSLSIATGAVRMAQTLFAEPHPMVARALALRARLLARSGASSEAIDEAFEDAMNHARQLPSDGTGDGLAVRVAWAEHLLTQSSRHQLALDITREAVTIARHRRAALRGAGGIIIDPAIRRAFILRGSALLAGPAKPTPTQMDEAFRTFQEAEVSLSAIAVARAALNRSARTEQEKALVATFDGAQRYARSQDKVLQDAVTRGDGQTVERLIISTRQAREREAIAEQEVRKAFPAYARAADQPVVTMESARDSLPAGSALLLLTADDQDVIALLLTKQDLNVNRLTGEATSVARKLGIVQCTLDPRYCTPDANAALSVSLAAAGWEPDDPRSAFDLATAQELYSNLLAPLLLRVPVGSLLLSVQQGWLASLSLASLPSARPLTADPFDPAGMQDVRWLADSYPIAMLPYAGILTQSRGPVQGRANRHPFFGVGNPVLSGKSGKSRGLGNLLTRRGSGWQVAPGQLSALAPLPATRAELESMAAVMRAPAIASLRLGADAREGQLRADARLAESDVIAVATHGLMPSELQGLQEPGLVMTPPDKPSDEDDGLWTASEVSLQSINASLVVLSACNTASSEGTPGADALSGLARAFFLSGARSVLASRWSVPDAPTAGLTVEALSGIAGGKLDQAHALQAAMKSVRTGRRADGTPLSAWTPDWAHPASWAAFSIYTSRLAN